jgi:hypothetical protein
MTLLISAEKRRRASWTIGCFSASSAAEPEAAARGFFGALFVGAGVPGRKLILRMPEGRTVVLRMRSDSPLRTTGSMVLESVVWMLRVSPERLKVESSICSEADCWPLTAARAETQAAWRADTSGEGVGVSATAEISMTSSREMGAVFGTAGGTRWGRSGAGSGTGVMVCAALDVGRGSGFDSGTRSGARAMEPRVLGCDGSKLEADATGVLRERSAAKGDGAEAATGIEILAGAAAAEDFIPRASGVLSTEAIRVGVLAGLAPSCERMSSTGRRRCTWTSLRRPSSRWKRCSWR